ncbi:hypothetical protein [Hymenobacter volaticus]|uniref:Uncharacterized protein n=1 Tax=Hymenobacter volaticus TaxID=2932254 RepID=A0ABY4G3G8_9BACT|nr:hypothetical protein [Hymenobacter volaticus]UOQ65387.1 hypothetical protein MUN86_17795 [Hymenobacter volaticus]
MSELQAFAARALRQLPTSLWWVLTLLIGAFIGIKLEKELFPNTPAAATVANWIVMACLVALLPIGIVWLWQVAMHMQHPGWRLLWYLAATGATGIGVLLAGILLFLVVMWI